MHERLLCKSQVVSALLRGYSQRNVRGRTALHSDMGRGCKCCTSHAIVWQSTSNGMGILQQDVHVIDLRDVDVPQQCIGIGPLEGISQ